MAKKSRSSADHDDHGLDEVDAFAASREQVFLNEAGQYGASQIDSDQQLDEEVMAIHSDDDDEEEDEENLLSGNDANGSDEDEEKGWGSKNNYYGGDDASDNEDATQMTQEALKQQKRHLQDLQVDDYVDEDLLQSWQKTADAYDGLAESKALISTVSITSGIHDLDATDQKHLLANLFPEFVPLLLEMKSLRSVLRELIASPENDIISVKVDALRAYLASVASYFALFTEKLRSGDTFATMKDEPVMECILGAREVWRQANELPAEVSSIEEATGSSEEMKVTADGRMVILGDNLEIETDDSNAQVQVSEVEADDSDEQEDVLEQDSDDFVDALDNIEIDLSKSRTIRKPKVLSAGDFSESAAPDAVDAEDKQRRRRTLRFYTSKIDQAASKRASTAVLGDTDLPYRERLFERQQRLTEEARRRGAGSLSAETALDNNDFDDQDIEAAQQVALAGDADYYAEHAGVKKDARAARAEAHAIATKAAKEGKLAEVLETLGPDGKRALNFQILKNKGLTPHRKKEFRNSRVKKRMQYDKAQKKLKSVRQVYSGENRGPYDGEKTGIKKGMSRSVKLV